MELVPDAFQGRTKYWVRSFFFVVIGGLLFDIGFKVRKYIAGPTCNDCRSSDLSPPKLITPKIIFYLLHKFIQPDMPLIADHFRNKVRRDKSTIKAQH